MGGLGSSWSQSRPPGGEREVLLIHPVGREEAVVRDLSPRVDQLAEALLRHLDTDAEVLEQLRDASVLLLVDRRLDQALSSLRRERAKAITTGHSRKAMIGAMAAITPGIGTDHPGGSGHLHREGDLRPRRGLGAADGYRGFPPIDSEKGGPYRGDPAGAGRQRAQGFPGIGNLAVGIPQAVA